MLKKLNTYIAQFSVFTPYPGTQAFYEYKNKIIAKKYEEFTQWQLVFIHENLNKLQISNLLLKAYEKYYLRVGWFIKHYRKIFKLFFR